MDGATSHERLLDIVNNLDQNQFRQLTTELLENMEFKITNSRSRANDVEVEAVRDMEGEQLPFIIKFKRGRAKVSPDQVQDIVGKKKGELDMKPIFISTSEFSHDAHKYADLLNVNLAGGEKFALLLKEFDMDKELQETESKTILAREGERFLPSIDELENQMRWGNDFYKSSNFKKALEYYDKALAMKPNYDIAWIMKGNALNALERYEEASKCFVKAVEAKSDSEEAWYNLGTTLYKLERFEEEIQAYDEALVINPDFIKAWNNKGATLHEMGKYDEAILCYDKIINLEPDNLNVLNNKGVALKHLKEYDEALESFDKAIEKKQEYTDAWINKALLLHEMGSFEDAVDCYSYILDKIKSPEIYYQKGIALMSLEKYRKAVEDFDNALLLKPRWKTALEQKELAEEAMKGLEDSRIQEEEEARLKEEEERQQREKEEEERLQKEEELRLAEEEKARIIAEEKKAQRIAEEEEKKLAEEKEIKLAEEKKLTEKMKKKKPETSDKGLAKDFEDLMVDEPEKEIEPEGIDDDMADLCNECETELNAKAKFCHNCGTRVVIPSEIELAEAIYCPECETEMDDDSEECVECGHVLGEDDGELEDIIKEEEEADLDPEIPLPVGEPKILEDIEERRAEELELEDEARLLESGILLTRLAEYEKALKCFNKAIALDENPKLWLEKGNLLFQMENYDEAIEAYDWVLKRNSTDLIALLNKQASLIEINELEDALTVNSRILEIEEAEPSIWAGRGYLMLELGNIEKAVECFEQALELAPEMVEFWNAQGAALLRLEKYDDAIMCFDKAIQIDPDFAEAWCNKGTARLSSGKPENSMRYFDRAIDIDPDYSLSWCNKASALYEMDRPDEALICMEQAMDAEEDPLFFNNKGFLLLSTDNLEEALENFDYAIELDEEYAEAWNNKGIVLSRQKETVEALDCFERALAISPKFKDAKRNRDAAVRAIEKLEVGKKKGKKKPKDRTGIEKAEELEADEIIAEEFRCPSCNAVGSIEDKFCDKCGIDFTAAEKDEAVLEELEELIKPKKEKKGKKKGKKKPGKKKKGAGKEEALEKKKPGKKKGKKKPGKKKKAGKKLTKEKFTNELVKVPGVGFSKSETIYDAGYDDFDKLKKAKVDELSGISGVSKKLARNIKKVYK